MKALTQKQTRVLDFIKHFVSQHKFPPTIREISDHFSISLRAGYDHIRALEKKQFVRCGNGRSRAIEVIDYPTPESGTRVIPILGVVRAGIPGSENQDGYVTVPEDFLHNGQYFALRIKGDSMIGAGIMEGDIAIIQEKNSARNGEIIVAMLDDSVTLKRYFRETNRVRLQTENPNYSAIYTQDIKILGRLAHIIRNY